MQQLYPLCRRLALTDVPLLIQGETGTGKEVLAESLHEQSRRTDKPFVVFDCTTVSPHLIEAALFGHQRGAFTDAVADRKGCFEMADGGTLFIDEIGELLPLLQPRLLRAMDRLEIRRVGGSDWTAVDVRLIVATRRDLGREVRAGRFREDLYYRLAVTRIHLPPLRQRPGDVALLAEVFWREFAAGRGPLPAHVLRTFENHRWPGNVRELRNAIARCAALGDLETPEPAPGRNGRPVVAPIPDEEDIVERVLELDLPLAEARSLMVRTLNSAIWRGSWPSMAAAPPGQRPRRG